MEMEEETVLNILNLKICFEFRNLKVTLRCFELVTNYFIKINLGGIRVDKTFQENHQIETNF